MAVTKQKFKVEASWGSVQEVEGIVEEYKELPNHQFGYVKEINDKYAVYHVKSGRVCQDGFKTLKSAKQAVLHALTSPEMRNMISNERTLEDRLNARDEFCKLREEFQKITHVTLSTNPILGLDIVKLDHDVETPDGTSLSDWLTQKYGKRANEIIDRMINIDLL